MPNKTIIIYFSDDTKESHAVIKWWVSRNVLYFTISTSTEGGSKLLGYPLTSIKRFEVVV